MVGGVAAAVQAADGEAAHKSASWRRPVGENMREVPYPRTYVFPFLQLTTSVTLRGLDFVPVPTSTAPLASDSRAIEQTLQVFGIDRGLGCWVPDEHAERRLRLALDVLKFHLLSKPRHVLDLHDEHFQVMWHHAGQEAHSFVGLEEKGRVTAGPPTQLHRRLPGPLTSQRVLPQHLSQRELDTLGQYLECRPRMRHSLGWWFRARRWSSDDYDQIVGVATALETLLSKGTREEKDRGELVGLRLTELLGGHKEEVTEWSVSFFRLRNHIVHKGTPAKAKLTFRDLSGFPVRSQALMGVLMYPAVFALAAERDVAQSDQDSLPGRMKHLMITDSAAGLLVSSKARLESLAAMLRSDLRPQAIQEATALAYAVTEHRDLSLSVVDYETYRDLFSEQATRLAKNKPTLARTLAELSEELNVRIIERL